MSGRFGFLLRCLTLCLAPVAADHSSGLDSRPPNTSCFALTRPATGFDVTLEHAFPQIFFALPVAMLQAPNDHSRWFIVEKDGRVRTFANDAAANQADVFVDIVDRTDSTYGEGGLMGMAFHPQFASNGQVFLSYTATGSPLASRISRFVSMDGGLCLDPQSEQIVLSVA